jgi:uncharacterized protein (UPF0548 family)
LTYDAVGATASRHPTGYRSLHRTTILRRDDYGAAVEDLMRWRVHLAAGLRVAASTPRAEQDTVVDMRLGLGALSLRVPCRVVYVVEEPRRQGFAYGTLPDHPESGEELFLLQQLADGRIELSISAFSRAASLAARLGGPVNRVLQDAMTTRYLKALDSLAR